MNPDFSDRECPLDGSDMESEEAQVENPVGEDVQGNPLSRQGFHHTQTNNSVSPLNTTHCLHRLQLRPRLSVSFSCMTAPWISMHYTKCFSWPQDITFVSSGATMRLSSSARCMFLPLSSRRKKLVTTFLMFSTLPEPLAVHRARREMIASSQTFLALC